MPESDAGRVRIYCDFLRRGFEVGNPERGGGGTAKRIAYLL